MGVGYVGWEGEQFLDRSYIKTSPWGPGQLAVRDMYAVFIKRQKKVSEGEKMENLAEGTRQLTCIS